MQRRELCRMAMVVDKFDFPISSAASMMENIVVMPENRYISPCLVSDTSPYGLLRSISDNRCKSRD